MSYNEEIMEEMRQDMLQEAWQEEQYEIKMRNDDDYFYDAIEDNFGETISELRIEIENFCNQYDRNANEWFDILLEK